MLIQISLEGFSSSFPAGGEVMSILTPERPAKCHKEACYTLADPQEDIESVSRFASPRFVSNHKWDSFFKTVAMIVVMMQIISSCV